MNNFLSTLHIFIKNLIFFSIKWNVKWSNTIDGWIYLVNDTKIYFLILFFEALLLRCNHIEIAIALFCDITKSVKIFCENILVGKKKNI